MATCLSTPSAAGGASIISTRFPLDSKTGHDALDAVIFVVKTLMTSGRSG